MGFLVQIISYAADSILWGLIIAITLCVLAYFFIKSWYSTNYYPKGNKLVRGCLWGVLAIVLSFQSILLIGAMKVRSFNRDIKDNVTTIVSSYCSTHNVTSDSPVDINLFTEFIEEEYPTVSGYITPDMLSSKSTMAAFTSISDYAESSLSAFIMRRLWWFIGIFIPAVFLLSRFYSNGSTATRSYSGSRAKSYDDYSSSRSYSRHYDD